MDRSDPSSPMSGSSNNRNKYMQNSLGLNKNDMRGKMAYLNPMRPLFNVDVNLFTSKPDPRYSTANEYLQERSNKDNKRKTYHMLSNENHMTDQGASY